MPKPAQRLAVVLQAPPELGAHRLLGEVGDVRDPARQREPVVGPHAVLVVVAAVEVLVLHDGRARDRAEGDVLRREPGARADHEPGAQLVGVVDRPLQDLHAADRSADRRERPLDAQVAEQTAVHGDEVAHGAEREAQSVRLAPARVDRARARSCPGSRPGGSRTRCTGGRCRAACPGRSGCPTSRGGPGCRGGRRRAHRPSARGRRRRSWTRSRRARRRSRRRPRRSPAARRIRARAGRAHPRARPAVSRPDRASAGRSPARRSR